MTSSLFERLDSYRRDATKPMAAPSEIVVMPAEVRNDVVKTLRRQHPVTRRQNDYIDRLRVSMSQPLAPTERGIHPGGDIARLVRAIVTTADGDLDVGLYDENGQRLLRQSTTEEDNVRRNAYTWFFQRQPFGRRLLTAYEDFCERAGLDHAPARNHPLWHYVDVAHARRDDIIRLGLPGDLLDDHIERLEQRRRARRSCVAYESA